MSVITQILDARLQPLREAYFTYHFEGLDHFITQTDGAREVVFETLQSLRELHDRVARRYVMDMFFSTKYQELVAVFMESTDRQAAYNILMQLDPSHSSAYDRLLN